ncbi:hypothetical protein EEL49_09500 [Muribaculaceae bacterium Isolate-104 (HZI)]|nr:hypothetical protein EEL49_09500 [Muribaculaceae bacterium Isolate-104 (HZI)]
MMNLCQCLQNNVVNSKLTCLIYSSLEALLNINVIATLEDSFNSTPWQQTFEFNSKDSGDNDGGKTPGIINPVNPGTITPIGL